MPTYLVLLGPPGAGKGTQAKILARRLGLPHISSGDLFREHLRKETELGKAARSYIDKGNLVPDDVTIAMVRERLERPDCADGAILDGFPRTPAQAEGLEGILQDLGDGLDAVLYMDVSEDVLRTRLTGRLVCEAQGHIYHEEHKQPEEEGVCDIDGSPLIQREDDNIETVLNRIDVYWEQTAPLIQYYRDRNLLIEVNGEQSVKAVTEEMMAAIMEAT
ncbi:MAG: adenylate kinase [Anaerolineales bacterium]|nr:adenylate kinase [Anaerolineales bacterium]